MELSFIWVEQFKNIFNAGFNLSSRFIFSFNNSNKELTVRPNPLHINNFFGDRISNITGIIGQNGSGKTNLLELINYVLDEGNTKIDRPFFIIYEVSHGMFELYQNGISVNDQTVGYHVSIHPYHKDERLFDSIFFSSAFDGRRHEFSKETIDLSTNKLLQYQFRENFTTKLYRDVQWQIKFLNSEQFKILLSVENDTQSHTDHLYPDRVLLIAPLWSTIINRAKIFQQVVTEAGFRSERPFEFLELCQSYRKRITNSQSPESIIYFTAFLVLTDYMFNVLAPKKNNGPNQLEITENKRTELYELLDSLTGITDLRIDEIHRLFTGRIVEILRKYERSTKARTEFLVNLRYSHFSGVVKSNEGKYTNRKVQFSIPYDDNVGEFINSYIDATSDSSLTYGIEWEGISSGHKAYLSLFSRFFSAAKDLKKNDVLITIDEGDLYFHPRWQTEFLYKVVNVIPKLLNKDSVQIVLTTHSPFLVSDLLKSNLIFLEKDIDGHCKVFPSGQVEGNTFGGNIGELYLDAFFLKEKSMSHFAYTKIANLIASIKQKGPSGLDDDERKLIHQLGELLIKNKVTSMINDHDTNRGSLS